MKKTVRTAALDMYNNEPNEGMRCVNDLVNEAAGRNKTGADLIFNSFNVRGANEIPDINEYDIFISTGGPGDPFEGEGSAWEKDYFQLLDAIWENNNQQNKQKKYAFFICHSFQLMARHFKFGQVRKRWRRSFGIWRFQKTAAGHDDPILRKLYNPFYAADSRYYEVIQPDMDILNQLGGSIIATELAHDDGHESAIMAVRISPEIVGTQFHPEADPDSMARNFRQLDRKKFIIENFGEQVYFQMLANIDNPISIKLTRNSVIPLFLDDAIAKLIKY